MAPALKYAGQPLGLEGVLRPISIAVAALGGYCLCATAAPASSDFNTDVAPILEARCIKCHSGAEPAAGLDARAFQGLLKGGKSGPAIAPGSSEHSLLLRRVRNGSMPPGGPALSAAEIGIIQGWIDAGARASDTAAAAETGTRPLDRSHWAFQTPVRPPTPRVRNARLVRTPIDAFLLEALEHRKLEYSPEADRPTLIRRASFDLLGLPPTADEVDRFRNDTAPDAYERLIDRLLGSPHYGERWARHWLDAAGYADSEGGESADVVRENAWRYRDYVIRAFNSDKPYDQFLREQLAGDELSEYWKEEKPSQKSVELLEATGFLRMAVDGSLTSHPRELNLDYLWKTLFDTQQIVASSILALTVQCARCHDHKYEPVSQKDYYRMQGLFFGAWRPDGPFLVAPDRKIVEATSSEQKHAQEVNQVQDPVIKALRDLLKARGGQFRLKHEKGMQATEAELKERFPEYAALTKQLEAEIKAEEAKRVELPAIRAFYDVDIKPPAVPVLPRGDYMAARNQTVEPGIPAVLDDPSHPFRIPEPTPGARSTGRRLAFAKWLTLPGHPLTARVMVNRIWFHHMGSGIVADLDNFGKSGSPPSNRALLDWLATEFVERGWSMKAMHRLIMTSSAYRQASKTRDSARELDPDNRLFWRMNPRRLEAEAARDAMLSISGTLDPKLYGTPVKSVTKPSGEVVPEEDSRRSLYLLVRRSAPQTFLNAFGAPPMEINCTRRSNYNSPLQALNLLNSEFASGQAERCAKILLQKSAGPSLDEAFRLVLSRNATPAETRLTTDFLTRQSNLYAAMEPSGRALHVWADLCQALLASNEFLYVD